MANCILSCHSLKFCFLQNHIICPFLLSTMYTPTNDRKFVRVYFYFSGILVRNITSKEWKLLKKLKKKKKKKKVKTTPKRVKLFQGAKWGKTLFIVMRKFYKEWNSLFIFVGVAVTLLEELCSFRVITSPFLGVVFFIFYFFSALSHSYLGTLSDRSLAPPIVGIAKMFTHYPLNVK